MRTTWNHGRETLSFPRKFPIGRIFKSSRSEFRPGVSRCLFLLSRTRVARDNDVATTGNVKHSCRKFEKTECSSRSVCILRSGDSSVFFFTHRSITPARERERERESLGVSSLIYRRRSRGRFSPRCLSTSGNPAVASGSHHLPCKNIYFIPGR